MKQGKDKKSHPDKQTNFWDFLINFTDKLFELFRSGYLSGAILLAFFIIIVILVIKLPSAPLIIFISSFFNFLSEEKFYVFPLCALIFIMIYWCIRQRNEYKKEIKRLQNIRKELMHGLNSGELKTLSNHNSCDFDFDKEG
ncbi:hypothetical protein [Seleniivibrio woodruffii]|uniref:hypothetical protein n=1 Tax=Seleniivibrio woodruffii TaxID=1078050 RepID=UPI002409B52D|nr:hypothetical protein [Seleniivibrio woodruffii]